MISISAPDRRWSWRLTFVELNYHRSLPAHLTRRLTYGATSEKHMAINGQLQERVFILSASVLQPSILSVGWCWSFRDHPLWHASSSKWLHSLRFLGRLSYKGSCSYHQFRLSTRILLPSGDFAELLWSRAMSVFYLNLSPSVTELSTRGVCRLLQISRCYLAATTIISTCLSRVK